VQSKAPSAAVKDLDRQIRSILRPIDVPKLDKGLRDNLSKMQQDLSDARVYASDYELSETREEQLDNAKQAKKYLNKVNRAVLNGSEYDIFNALDVAHLSALIDQIRADLK
jgi:ribosome-binding factor A